MTERSRFVQLPGGRLKRLTGRRGGNGPSAKDGDIVAWGPEQGSKQRYHQSHRMRVKRQLASEAHKDDIVLALLPEMSAHKWFGVYMS